MTGPRPISAAGSTYKTGRKAKAEREKAVATAKAAAGTTRPKNATGKVLKRLLRQERAPRPRHEVH